jgi:hypothetical protein
MWERFKGRGEWWGWRQQTRIMLWTHGMNVTNKKNARTRMCVEPREDFALALAGDEFPAGLTFFVTISVVVPVSIALSIRSLLSDELFSHASSCQ